MSSDDVNNFAGNKCDVVTDVKEEDDPWPATSMELEIEPAVSYMSVCIKVYAHWTHNVQTVCRVRCEWKVLFFF
jgi:hypothetical protein